MTQRTVTRIVPSMPTSDGAGVKLRRVIGTPALRNLDPFLLLDEFYSDDPDDYIAGFPSHPHRGFETVTYMIAGNMQHKDSLGNTGDLTAGSVQWMTAASGIIHSEMPQQEDGLLHGFQLWVNLPAKDKMGPPRYQDIPPEAIGEVEVPGGRVRVLAGEVHGVKGPVGGVATRPVMVDVRLDPGAEIMQPIPPGHTAFAYVFDGSVRVAGQEVPRGNLAVLSDGDAVTLTGGADGGRVLVVAGRPIGEPIVQYGPFVMNTKAEIVQAITDYQQGRLVRT